MNSTERHEARFQRRKARREAKRQEQLAPYDDFERVADVDHLYRAFQRAMRGVSWKESVQRYKANALRNIIETRRKLLAGESVQKGFVEFVLNERGKIRHIKSVHISERIVQKCLCDEVLVPILSHSLIHDNGASVKRKGVHFAIQRFVVHLSRFYRKNRSNDGYVLLIDFSKFFDNIDHATLFRLLEQKIHDRRVLALSRSFISVFGNGKSLGLGSQISQICAIYYPCLLDHFIKEKLRVEYYGRYMDDLYLIHQDKAYLNHCLHEIVRICDQLKIKINMKKTKIMKLSEPMIFLKGKYALLPSGKIIRRPCRDSTIRMRRKLLKFKGLIDKGKMGYADLRTSYQSWRGNFRRRFNAYHRLRHMDTFYNSLFIYNHTP